MQKRKCLNVGVIGMGKMGLLHTSIVNTLPGVRVLAIYDKNSTMVKFAKKTFTEICVTDNLEKLSDFHLDAVYVTTPIPTHFSVVEAIYSMGIAKNLFVEKTLASNYKQAAQLCQEAKAVGGVNMVGYMSRFGPTFKKAKALLQQEVVGNPISFKAYAYASDFAGVREKSLPGKGGATRDLGAHVIDISLWFFGELEVKAAMPEVSGTENYESSSRFKTYNSKGLTGEFDISWAKAGYRLPEFGLAIRGSKGVLTVNADVVKLERNTGDIISWHRQDLHDNVPFLLGASEYYHEDEHFVSAILEGESAEPNFVTASKVDLLINQAESHMEVL